MTADTEEIIDLTDLIEEGEPSATTSRPSAEKDSLEEQLQSLNDVPHASDDAIDSLLQEMGQGAAAPNAVQELNSPSLSGPDAPSQGPDENPNEKIVMPGIDDVDALLDHLDIPSQPHTSRVEPVADGAALDSAVEDLLSSAGVNIPPAAPAKPAAAPSASAGDEMDDLLRDVSGGAAASPAPKRPSPDDDIEAALDADLTSLMADMGDPEPPSPPSDAAVSSPRKTAEEELDDLLATDTDIPPAAARPAPAAPARPAMPKTASGTAAPRPAQKPASKPVAKATASGSVAKPAAQPAPAAPAPKNAAAAPVGKAAPAPQSPQAEDVDLDALLATSPAPAQASVPPTVDETAAMLDAVPGAPATEAEGMPDLDAMFTEELEALEKKSKTAAAPASAADADAMLADLDAALGETPAEPAPETAAPAPAADADDVPAIVTEQSAADEATPVEEGEAVAPSEEETIFVAEMPETDGESMSQAGASASPAVMAQLTDRLEVLEAFVNETRERLGSLEDGLSTGSQELVDRIEAAEAAATAAQRDDGQTERLEQVEAAQGAVQSRLDELAGRVDAAEAAATAAQQDGELAERLEKLETQARSVSARLDALEKRLDEMSPAFNERIEKAAAAAAARILREEIARLLQG